MLDPRAGGVQVLPFLPCSGSGPDLGFLVKGGDFVCQMRLTCCHEHHAPLL